MRRTEWRHGSSDHHRRKLFPVPDVAVEVAEDDVVLAGADVSPDRGQELLVVGGAAGVDVDPPAAPPKGAGSAALLDVGLQETGSRRGSGPGELRQLNEVAKDSTGDLAMTA